MQQLSILFALNGPFYLSFTPSKSWDTEEGIRIVLHAYSASSNQPQRRQSIKFVEEAVKRNSIPWISPSKNKWTFDLDILRTELSKYENISWLTGKVHIEPEFEVMEKKSFDRRLFESSIVFYITPEEISNLNERLLQAPIEMHESLLRFNKDYPDPKKTAFIMMKLGTTGAHENIVGVIRNYLMSVGITALRADDKQYHDDLFPNVLTYLWGCAFGIAVFERIEADDFNPNVSLEVGYMFALHKPVCLLKDKTLKTLHTDLIGKLYSVFDPQDPTSSIPPVLTQWLGDKDIV